jgi:integrase
VDAKSDMLTEADRKPLTEHLNDYLDYSAQVGQAKRHVVCKRAHLTGLVEGTKSSRLADLTVQRVTAHLQDLKKRGKAARTVNACRATVVAFMQWCYRQERVAENRLGLTPRFDERKDRRRRRRALTMDEFQSLLDGVRQRMGLTGDRWVSREAFYSIAFFTGLRRSEQRALRWGDVDLDRAVLTVRAEASKAKREDHLPLHPQAVASFRSIRTADAKASDLVFRTLPTIRTFYEDLARAGIAKRDDQGRVVDLHALRTTLATELARRGVAPQLAQQLLRHKDARTTLTHYTALGLEDAAAAVGKIPSLGQNGDDKVDRQPRGG